MKFSVATIAVLATAVTAQYGQPQQQYGQQAQRPQQPSQQYQAFPAQQQYGGYSAPAAQTNKYSPAEYQEWHQCVDRFLDGFNNDKDGSAAGCQYWTCIEGAATKYGRGGILATAGNVVSKLCAASGFLPNWL